VEAEIPDELPKDINAAVDDSPLRCLDPEATKEMMAAIDRAGQEGDTLGGVFEVVVQGLPVGLGSHVAWDERLDGRLAGAIMSIQAIKAVEVGDGVAAAGRPGTKVHDPITREDEHGRGGGFSRSSNRAGGLEGGTTTGAPLVVRGYMKPISTLRNRLPSVDLRDGSEADAATERSDVSAVPAAGVIGEAMVALVVADAFLEKFGGDSVEEIRRNFQGYLRHLEERGFGERPLPDVAAPDQAPGA
jgi:chorismate synthase